MSQNSACNFFSRLYSTCLGQDTEKQSREQQLRGYTCKQRISQFHGAVETETGAEGLRRQIAVVNTPRFQLKSQKSYPLGEKGKTEIHQLSKNQNDLLSFYLLFRRKLNLSLWRMTAVQCHTYIKIYYT